MANVVSRRAAVFLGLAVAGTAAYSVAAPKRNLSLASAKKNVVESEYCDCKPLWDCIQEGGQECDRLDKDLRACLIRSVSIKEIDFH
jgi:hypothetical protein